MPSGIVIWHCPSSLGPCFATEDAVIGCEDGGRRTDRRETAAEEDFNIMTATEEARSQQHHGPRGYVGACAVGWEHEA